MPQGLEPLPERMQMRLRLHYDPMRHPWDIGLYLYGRDNRGNRLRVVKPPEVEIVNGEDYNLTQQENQPIAMIERGENDANLQSLMDDLWALGVRPKDVGTAGHLAATQSHLADFRAIAAKILDVKLP
jgi:hypothetical protein